MLRHELTIEQSEIADLQARDQPCKRNLRSVTSAAEHALAKEGAAELDAIEAANELAIAPYLDRMGMTRLMKRKHCAFELGVDPCLVAVGASRDHCLEIAVVSDVEPARTERAPERARKMKAVQGQDGAVARFDPEELGGLAAVCHRENAGGITLQQQARVEATHGFIMKPSAPGL
jgi:hypothetical protein